MNPRTVADVRAMLAGLPFGDDVDIELAIVKDELPDDVTPQPHVHDVDEPVEAEQEGKPRRRKRKS